MKISQLPKLSAVRRDIEFPLAVQGENRSITMGQITDAMPKAVVPFSTIRDSDFNVQYVVGTATESRGSVLFDAVTAKFYRAFSTVSNNAGQLVTMWTYFKNWDTYGSYYGEDGSVRTDCLFRSNDGRLYFFDGEMLLSAGITDEQDEQIRHSAPIEVESEEEMERRIAAGEYEEGQLYFLAEE